MPIKCKYCNSEPESKRTICLRCFYSMEKIYGKKVKK